MMRAGYAYSPQRDWRVRVLSLRYEEQMSSGSSLWAIPQHVANMERRQIAILGFLTGLALSALIGAVLYFCLVGD
jgi:hypothetical protein